MLTPYAQNHFLNGTDLIALGVATGPQIQKLLDTVYDEQLEGQILDIAAAKKFVKIAIINAQ